MNSIHVKAIRYTHTCKMNHACECKENLCKAHLLDYWMWSKFDPVAAYLLNLFQLWDESFFCTFMIWGSKWGVLSLYNAVSILVENLVVLSYKLTYVTCLYSTF